MSEKFYTDNNGNFLGTFAGGAVPPAKAIEVPTAPAHAAYQWNGTTWVEDAAKPMREWQKQIAETDQTMPRYAEDIIDAMDAPSRARIVQVTLDKYNAKKALRASKPGA